MEIGILLTYGTLLLCVFTTLIKIKIYQNIQLWQITLGIAIILAYFFDRANIFSIIYSLIFGFIVFKFYQTKRILYLLGTIVLAVPLLAHSKWTGFVNYPYLKSIQVTDLAIPYSLYFNFDKTLVGIFILGFSINCKNLYPISILKILAWLLPSMCLLFLGLSLVLGYANFEPKIPSFLPVWIMVNLFSTCFAEEFFFRGFIQKNLGSLLKHKNKEFLSLIISSILFGFFHFKGGPMYILLSLIAGVFYGYIYTKTKRVESSILLHFLFNLTHLLLFTYPALK